jgi:hypothetical protein
MRRLLSRITLIAAQNEEDGNRFLSLGLKRNQLAVTGSLKFDISVTPELAAARLRCAASGRRTAKSGLPPAPTTAKNKSSCRRIKSCWRPSRTCC